MFLNHCSYCVMFVFFPSENEKYLFLLHFQVFALCANINLDWTIICLNFLWRRFWCCSFCYENCSQLRFFREIVLSVASSTGDFFLFEPLISKSTEEIKPLLIFKSSAPLKKWAKICIFLQIILLSDRTDRCCVFFASKYLSRIRPVHWILAEQWQSSPVGLASHQKIWFLRFGFRVKFWYKFDVQPVKKKPV